MKFCTVAAVLLVSLFATAMAGRVAYYQQPALYSNAVPARLMYLQLVQQPSPLIRAPARLTKAAYVAEEATEEQQVADESGIDADVAEPEQPEETQVLEDEVAPVAEEAPIAEEAPVEAKSEPEVDADDEETADDDEVARVPKASPAPLPVGTFFPIQFQGVQGAAIAIANSFSTGEGGSATSHAIAYGKPAESVKSRPVRRH